MATTSKVFFRGAATTSSTTLYTVSSTAATAVVTNMVVTNTTTSAATFTVNIDSVAIASSASIAANTTAIFDLKQVIPANNPAKTVSGLASTTGVVFHISGVEIV
jgi:hypothetical protein